MWQELCVPTTFTETLQLHYKSGILRIAPLAFQSGIVRRTPPPVTLHSGMVDWKCVCQELFYRRFFAKSNTVNSSTCITEKGRKGKEGKLKEWKGNEKGTRKIEHFEFPLHLPRVFSAILSAPKFSPPTYLSKPSPTLNLNSFSPLRSKHPRSARAMECCGALKLWSVVEC